MANYVFMLNTFYLHVLGSRDQKLILDSLKTVKVPIFEPKSGLF